MIRVAAVGDVHFGTDSRGSLAPYLEHLAERADLLLIAGDLTRHGAADEADVLAEELRAAAVPVFIVLGNHDYHQDQQNLVRESLEAAGHTVLEGETATLSVNGTSVGIAGIKGFGGGFAGACGSDFGEPQMKDFIRHTKQAAGRLRECLESLDTHIRIALTHYAPAEQTLEGERREIYPFLGSYLLGEAMDSGRVDVAFHGHAHHGAERGSTPGGVPVRNVAQPLIQRAYSLLQL